MADECESSIENLRVELASKFDDIQSRLATIDHQIKQLADALVSRAGKLEQDVLAHSKVISHSSEKLDEIHPALMDLRGLMQVWARTRRVRDSE